MKKHVEQMMNEYEGNFSDEKELNNLAIDDLESLGSLYSSKPLIMHAAYGLDGNTKRRGHYGNNYDNFLSDYEKNEIEKDIMEKAELNALIHHPHAILDESDDFSENRGLARDVLKHLQETYGGNIPHEVVVSTVIEPLVKKLIDQVMDKGNILHAILHPTMVKDTEHDIEHYGHLLSHMLLSGPMHHKSEKNWVA